jgi:hypothetical protein
MSRLGLQNWELEFCMRLPLAFIGVAFFPAEEAHCFNVLDVLWTIHRREHVLPRADRILSPHHFVQHLFQTHFRRVQVAPAFDSDFVVRHSSPSHSFVSVDSGPEETENQAETRNIWDLRSRVLHEVWVSNFEGLSAGLARRSGFFNIS